MHQLYEYNFITSAMLSNNISYQEKIQNFLKISNGILVYFENSRKSRKSGHLTVLHVGVIFKSIDERMGIT